MIMDNNNANYSAGIVLGPYACVLGNCRLLRIRLISTEILSADLTLAIQPKLDVSRFNEPATCTASRLLWPNLCCLSKQGWFWAIIGETTKQPLIGPGLTKREIGDFDRIKVDL